MKNIAYIYPTSRAIREKKEQFLKENALIPKMFTVADFESRVVLTPYKRVDTLHRTLFLKEASKQEKFNRFFKERSLVRFYTQSDDFFKFFEELALEKVSLNDLYLADTYAEFAEDLELLGELLADYEKILKDHNYTDRAFLPKEYHINWDFLDNFDAFHFLLEGFLSRFELELFFEIAKRKPFIIEFRTTQFNTKMIESFREFGIELKSFYSYHIDLSSLKIIKATSCNLSFENIEVLKVKERLEQIALAFAKIEAFVQSGIEPQKIALITPDETIAKMIATLDREHNCNFAMGRSFADEKSTIMLIQIERFLKGESLAKDFLEHQEFNRELLERLRVQEKMDVKGFFTLLKELELPLYKEEDFLEQLDSYNLLRKFYNFTKVFGAYHFSFKEWLFFWLDILKKHTLDDVSGGKVTVMGLLETRSVTFDAVVVIDFNEGIVPARVSKDRFLNSAVRSYAKLPTSKDRENLQKHYYARLFEKAKKTALIFVENAETAPSRFLYELNLTDKIKHYQAALEIFYPQKSCFFDKAHLEDKEIAFDAKSMLWSSSKLRLFLECKRKFFYRYILKLQEDEQSLEASDGSILHALLAKVLVPGRNFDSLEELKKAFLVALEEFSHNKNFAFRSRLWVKFIDKFLAAQIEHFKNGWSIKRVEHGVRGFINGLEFTGRVDRIDKRGDFYLVIDYKSSQSATRTVKNLEKITDFQMSIYKRLLALNDTKVDFAYWPILEGGRLHLLEEQEEKEQKLLEHIEYIKAQKSFVASRCENLQLCRSCSYRLLCHRGEYL